MCVRGIDFVFFFYDFAIGLWNSFDGVVYFCLYFLNLCSAIEIKFMSKAGICIFNVASTNKTNKRISLTTKRQRHTTVEIQVLAKYVGVNCLKECKPSHLDNWISNGNTYINKR